MRRRVVTLCLCGSVLGLYGVSTGSALANGLGEDRPFQFRSTNERQGLLNIDRTRLELKGAFDTGVGSTAGLGTSQTGNTLNITINGNGDNTITVDQDNSGDQNLQDADDNSSILNN